MLGTLGDARLSAIVDRYVGAWERHDVDTLVAMLTESVTIAMPPTTTWYRAARQSRHSCDPARWTAACAGA
jgi:RNA polymerase sigma-70 factor (ECF subfamily)